jgi:hypothetical protein
MVFFFSFLFSQLQKAPKACKVRFPPGEKVVGRFKNASTKAWRCYAFIFIFIFVVFWA